jgi:prepilin-type N-terminal cleavage/methylation domain-containing protein
VFALKSAFHSISRVKSGFSLVELLIALAILGTLATVLIPKISTSMVANPQKNTATAKTVAIMVLNAFERYNSSHGGITTSLTVSDLTPYMNFISVDTTSIVDDHPGSGTGNCSDSSTMCLKMYSGGILWFNNWCPLVGLTSVNALFLNYDPDGKISNDKALDILLYSDGSIKTKGTGKTGTQVCYNPAATGGSYDPDWFLGF